MGDGDGARRGWEEKLLQGGRERNWEVGVMVTKRGGGRKGRIHKGGRHFTANPVVGLPVDVSLLYYFSARHTQLLYYFCHSRVLFFSVWLCCCCSGNSVVPLCHFLYSFLFLYCVSQFIFCNSFFFFFCVTGVSDSLCSYCCCSLASLVLLYLFFFLCPLLFSLVNLSLGLCSSFVTFFFFFSKQRRQFTSINRSRNRNTPR